MDTEFLVARIAVTKTMIAAYEDAIIAFSVDPTLQNYTLDTGQSVQTARRHDLDQIQGTLDMLYNRLCMMETRLAGSGSILVQPAW